METSAAPAQPAAAARLAVVDLVAAIAAGSAEAEDDLVQRFRRPVELLLARHTRSPDEAEDLFQETFRLGLEKLRRGELREADKLPAFLAGLAKNLAIEVYRKAGRRKTEPDSEAMDRHESARPSPWSDALAAEHATLVRRVLRELRNDRDRQVLYRFYLLEEDRETIAGDFELTPLQFNRVLHRARQRFRELAERVPGLATWSAAVIWVCLAQLWLRP
ncbi:MAG: sigma-70 family RNA polymerase sigma factor, partial [Acidobacteria bacterium]|nr:sigma-70 family RNA polymerase sigma factor [Acidobacteriota bacterium]